MTSPNQCEASDSSASSENRSTPTWVSRCVIVLTLIACAVPMSGNNADADLWGHVQFGRDVMRHGLPSSTTYSFTAVGYPWINHENLSELTFAVIADWVGGAGLLLLKCLLGVSVAAAMLYRQRQQGVSLFVACGVTLLVALNLNFFWQVRPQLFSYVFYAAMLLMLSHCFDQWEGRWRLARFAKSDRADADLDIPYRSERMRRLWLAPILFVVWTNTHGAFSAGLAIFVTYLILRAIEAWTVWREKSWGIVGRLGMMATAASLATFLNPYGPRLHAWLLHSLSEPRPEITEWHPPPLLSPEWFPLTIAIGLFMATIAFTKRSRDFTHLLVTGATLWQTLEHQRHAPFFVLAFGFWMAPHVDSLVQRLAAIRGERERQESSLLVARIFGISMVAASVVIGSMVVDRLKVMNVRRDEYPVAALEFMHSRDLSGRAVVTYNWAQYVIGCFGDRNIDGRADAGVQLAFDGRFRTCYPQQVVDMHFDFVLGDIPHLRFRSDQSPNFEPGQFEGEQVLKHALPDMALICRHQPHSEFVMVGQPDWILLYQDELAQLWGRKSIYDEPTSPRYLAPPRRVIGDAKQIGSVAWPALPGRKSDQRQVARS